MSASAKSVFAFGLWTVVAGLGLLLIPTQLLGILNLTVAEPVYIRVIGFILIEIGLLYVWLSKHNIIGAFVISVYIRLIPFALLTLFVLTGIGPWQLILFALVDVISAAHTWLCLKREN